MKAREWAVLFVVALGCSAWAQTAPQPSVQQPQHEDRRDDRRWWGIDVGVFRPMSGEIRDKFGDNLLRIGFRPFSRRISDDWKFIFDFMIISASRRGNRMLVVPITFGFTRSFAKPDDDTIPFVQLGAGPAYYDYSIERDTGVPPAGVGSIERFRGKKIGGNANVELGVIWNQRFALVGRADFFTKTDDFDFSGLTFTLSWAAFKW
jgi:hypothetical protein